MKTKNISFLNEKQKTALINNNVDNIFSSVILDKLKTLLKDKFVYSNSSNSKSNPTPHAYALIKILNILNIKHEQGNDAPRGGKMGEFIKLV